jgi:hypothetical protein
MDQRMPKSSKAAEGFRVDSAPVAQMLLDSYNPRLAVAGSGRTQKDLLKFLWDEMAVDEIALSIAANGFFPEEALLVVPAPPDKSLAGESAKYVVVEGNRRLAAILLLCDSSMATEIGADLPAISPAAAAALERVPVVVYEDRRQLWQYLAFRHINGQKPWDAISKARYVAHVVEEYDIPLDRVADHIGDRHATVRRLYRGYKIMEQAQREGLFAPEDVFRKRFYFSHLYTAADQPEFQKFLGIRPDAWGDNPVPKSKRRELGDLMRWLYGRRSRNEEPLVRSQNPDLNTLRAVISEPRALAALRSGFSLERSYEISIGDERRFEEALARAKEDLQQAKATVTLGYSGEDGSLAIVDEIVQVANSLRAEMRDIRERPKAARTR